MKKDGKMKTECNKCARAHALILIYPSLLLCFAQNLPSFFMTFFHMVNFILLSF